MKTANYENQYLRHTLFSKNDKKVTEKDIFKYKKIVNSVSTNFSCKYGYILNPFGFLKEDLENIGLFHATTFIKNYETEDEFKNKQIFKRFLIQRFKELLDLNTNRIARHSPEVKLKSEYNPEWIENPEEEREDNFINIIYNGKTSELRLEHNGLAHDLYLDGKKLSKEEEDKFRKDFHSQKVGFVKDLNGIPNEIEYKNRMKTKVILRNKLKQLTSVELESKLRDIIDNECASEDVLSLAKKILRPTFRKKRSSLKRNRDLDKIKKKECHDLLPEKIVCCFCSRELHKSHFGVTISKRDEFGNAVSARRKPYCAECTKKWDKIRAETMAELLENNSTA